MRLVALVDGDDHARQPLERARVRGACPRRSRGRPRRGPRARGRAPSRRRRLRRRVRPASWPIVLAATVCRPAVTGASSCSAIRSASERSPFTVSSLATESTGVVPIASRSSRAISTQPVGVTREHDQVDPCDRVRVAPALHAELRTCSPSALGVARADDHLVTLLGEPARERSAELPGAPDDRDLHAASTASARRRRASASDISVFVTTGRTARFSTSWASASSRTSASISPA